MTSPVKKLKKKCAEESKFDCDRLLPQGLEAKSRTLVEVCPYRSFPKSCSKRMFVFTVTVFTHTPGVDYMRGIV